MKVTVKRYKEIIKLGIDNDYLYKLFGEDVGYSILDGIGQERLYLVEEKKIIGCVWINNYEIQYNLGDWDYKFDIAIREDKRGKGYAKILLDAMLSDFVYNFPESKQIRANVVNEELEAYIKKRYKFKCKDIWNYGIERSCTLSRKMATQFVNNNNIPKMNFGGNLTTFVYEIGGL